MPVSRIAKVILKKKPKRGAMKPISAKKKRANELKRKASRIMGQAMKPEMRKDKRKEAESLRAQAAKLAKEAGFEEIKRGAGGVIKKGIKAVVKRGRKSKRGRPKTKKEVVKKIVKKQDPSKIKKLPGESDAAYKKRKALINKLKNQSIKDTAKDSGKKLPTTKDRTSRSMTIPLKRKEQSKASFRRRVMQGLQGVTKKGESKDIGKAGYPVSETMRELGYTGSRKAKVDLTDKELEALGFQIKKAGGMLKSIPTGNKGLPNLPTPVRNKMGFKKYGGKIKRLAVGGGVALRGLGVTRKK